MQSNNPHQKPLAIVLGTRPEIIKLAPVIHEAQKRGLPYVVLHTGQHYDEILDAVFFEELALPKPDFQLNTGRDALPYPEKLGLMVARIEEVLRSNPVSVVLVQGDTTSALAGALAAKRLGLPVAHLEAGLRSRDYAMTEEWNRIMIDKIADYFFAPTEACRTQLLEEFVAPEAVHVVGNTVVDAVLRHRELGETTSPEFLAAHGLSKGKYLLATLHRAENTDVQERLQGAMEGIARAGEEHKLPVVLPLHPRTKHMIEHFGLRVPKGITIIEPLPYIAFLQLEANARLIITDSGGLQEEASILGIPCVTIRDNTERPETVEAGVNLLAGTDPLTIAEAVRTMFSREYVKVDLYGNGSTAAHVLDVLFA